MPRAAAPAAFRLPAYPLIAHTPYFSLWSCSDTPAEASTRHWTGHAQGLSALARVDSRAFRLFGTQPKAEAATVSACEVRPTRTVYRFDLRGVELTLSFLTPALPHDLEALGRPVTYVIWDARARDGRPHRVAVYLGVSADWTVDQPGQRVQTARFDLGDLAVLRAGSSAQPVLNRSGDNLRIDWGYLYLAAAQGPGAASVIAGADASRRAFAASGRLPAADEIRPAAPASAGWPSLAVAFDLGRVGPAARRRVALLAYDEVFSVEYLEQRLRPWWRRDGAEADDLLRQAWADFARLDHACAAFDRELVRDLRAAGGETYARLGALAHRQCLAAHALVAGPRGEPWFFSKENFSNGCIATVDVTYPSAPLALLLNPALLKGMVTPVLDYASLPRWRFDFAPHDLGTYPLANGQVYGGGERTEENQMPVEECGNLLILAGAIAEADGDAEYARRYWPLLSRWAAYLKGKGMDPEEQLCTDDFAGHLAHNTNLSIKAIVALACYGKLAGQLGHRAQGAAYGRAARAMARRWVRQAGDGDHFRLAFDRPGTWSQKYNLVWDRLLGLNLFPPAVAAKEVAFYLGRQQRYGLPLDSRRTYTKLDWIVWTATLAASQRDFRALIEPLGRWMQETPSRVPLTDWYETTDGRQVGFQARSVVGGVFIKLLADRARWRKWLKRAAGHPSARR